MGPKSDRNSQRSDSEPSSSTAFLDNNVDVFKAPLPRFIEPTKEQVINVRFH